MLEDRKYFFVIVNFLLILIPFLLSAQEKTNSTSNEIVVKHVSSTYYESKLSSDGYTQAVLTGNVDILFFGYSILADQVIIKFRNGKAVFITAKGNLLIKSADNIIAAQALFLEIKKKDMVVLDGFSTKNNNYMGSFSATLRQKGITSVHTIKLTSSKHLYPHYMLKGSMGWIEQNDDLLMLGATMQIGQDPVVYFPLFYNTDYGTGLVTALSFSAYLGFILNNTYKQETPTTKEIFMFDHYQKLGQYLGNTYSRTDIGNLNVHVGLAYDRHILYQNGVVQNYFEQIVGEGPSGGRSLRYNLLLDYQADIYKAQEDDPSHSSLTFKGSFKELSDPVFTQQFEDQRKGEFDPKSIIFSSTDTSILDSLASSSISNVEGRVIDLLLTYNFYGFSMELGQTFRYVLSPKKNSSSTEALNSFSPSYYHNTLSEVSYPAFTLRKNFDIYSLNKSFGQGSSLSMPISLNFTYQFNDLQYYQPEGLESKTVTSNVIGVLDLPLTITSGIFTFRIPFSVNSKFTYGGYGFYDYHNSSAVSTYYNRVFSSTIFNYAPDISFKLGAHVLQFTSTLNTLYEVQNQDTEDKNENQYQNDLTNSYTNIQQNIGELASFTWNNDNPYFKGYVNAQYLYLDSKHTGARLPKEQRTRTRKNTYIGNLYAFKTLLTLSTYDQTGTTILKENRNAPLTVALSSTVIPYMNIINTFQWDRFNEISSNNSLELALKIPLRANITDTFWFDSVDIDVLWSRNYVDSTLDYLTYKFSFQFNITDLFQFSFDLTGKNYHLYLYTDAAPKGSRLSFWKDLLKSFMFWSTKARQESNFKMEAFGFTLSHDLDEWELKFSGEFAPRLGRTGTYYFDSQFYIEVILKDLDMLSAPKMIQGENGDS
jgi:hypothetical protein